MIYLNLAATEPKFLEFVSIHEGTSHDLLRSAPSSSKELLPKPMISLGLLIYI